MFTERKTKVSDKVYPPLSVTKQGIMPQLEHAAKSDDSDNRKLVCAGDFVINSRSDRKGSCGLSDFTGSVSLINIALIPGDLLHKRYVHYLLGCHPFSEEYYRLGKGIVADLWTTRFTEMKSIYIPVPPKDEQDQIARFLDWKITAIDKLISIRREELRNLADLRKALITREVTRGNWECVRLKNVVRVRSEKGTYRDKTDDKYIGLENIRGYSDKLIETDTEYDTSTQSICREGDLLFGKLRPYLAKVVIAPYDAFCTGELLIISGFDGDMRYLRYVMLSYDFITEVDSSTYGAKMPRANSAFILNISIPIPPTTEQKRIANYLDRICTRIDSAITNFTQQIDTLKELKACLISDAVTGKIDVRNITVPEEEKKS